MILYFDNDVLIEIEKGNLDSFKQTLSSFQTEKKIEIPFSFTHIQEANNIQSSNRNSLLKKRFDLISAITNNTYLYTDINDKTTKFLDETPEEVYNTLEESEMYSPVINELNNFISSDDRRKFRDDLDIQVDELNSIKSPNIIKKLNKYLKSKLENHKDIYIKDFDLREMLITAIQFHPDYKNFSLENYIAGFFNLLNIFGFQKERNKKEREKPLTYFYDACHAINTIYADFFVTNDVKLRIKSMVSYEFFNIYTKVVDANEMQNILISMYARKE